MQVIMSYSQSLALAIALLLIFGAWGAIAFIWRRACLERAEYEKKLQMTLENTEGQYHLVAVARYQDSHGEYVVYLEEGRKLRNGRNVNLRKHSVIRGDEGRAKQHEAFALFIGPWTKFGIEVSDIPQKYLFLAYRQFIGLDEQTSYPEAEKLIAALERAGELGARGDPPRP